MSDRPFLTILIPVYNEAPTLFELLHRVQLACVSLPARCEVILINDGSTDSFVSEYERFEKTFPNSRFRVINHPRNRGKGASIRWAIPEARGEYVLIQDADLEYAPSDYHALLDPVLTKKCDVVYGSRFLNKRSLLSMQHSQRYANSLLTALCNAFLPHRLTDMETCYKLMPTAVLKSLLLRENRFGFEPEVTLKLGRIAHLRWCEVAIEYKGRQHHQGKKIGFIDGLRALYCLLVYGVLRRN